MAQRSLLQPELLILLTAALLAGCLAPRDPDCAEPSLSPSSVEETPTLEDLQIPVETFVTDLERTKNAQMVAGDEWGRLPHGQMPLDAPLPVQVELSYEREGELVTPDAGCGPAYLSLPVNLAVKHEGEVLLTASGTGPVGWQLDGSPRAELIAAYEPHLWEVLRIDPPSLEQPVASVSVYYRADTAEAIEIELRHCARSTPGCPPDFAFIEWTAD